MIATSVLSLVAICLTACGFVGPVGDLTRAVRIRNHMDVPVVEYSYGRRDARYRERLAVGESIVQTWMYPISPGDSRKRRIEADDEAGTLVFCSDVGYEDLVKSEWRVDIAPGHERCP